MKMKISLYGLNVKGRPVKILEVIKDNDIISSFFEELNRDLKDNSVIIKTYDTHYNVYLKNKIVKKVELYD